MRVRRFVFFLAFYDAFYLSPARNKRLAELEAAKARKKRARAEAAAAAVTSRAVARAGAGGMAARDESSGGTVPSPERRFSPQKPLWDEST